MNSMKNDRLTLRAPAKLNLTLAVKGRRADGYHDLESWVVLIDRYDELSFEPSAHFCLDVENNPSVPTDERNLIHQAAVRLAERSGIEPRAHVRLFKRIPAGAGLGGGSSDAAACLVGLNQLWSLRCGVEELSEIGLHVGSDVPLFIHGGQVIMRGRGEVLQPLDNTLTGWVVLICPKLQVATGEVYAAYDHAARDRCETRPWELAELSCRSVMPQLFNDLERAAFAVEPEVQQLHARLDGLHDQRVRMTGSGSAMFTLFDQAQDARHWASLAADAVPVAVHVHKILSASADARI